MQSEEFFSPNPVNIENIAALSNEQSLVFEKKICELYEIANDAATLASELCERGFGIYELMELIADGIDISDFSLREGVMTKNLDVLMSYMASLSSYDKAMFASLFTKRLKESGIGVSEDDFLSWGGGDASVVYVKNRLSDEAYDVFSDSIDGATVSYVENLRLAAEAVSEGKSEFAILPLEEKGGARLASIAALLFKYDLKIASVTPVFGFDGTADVKYALVSKHFKIPEVDVDDDRYLEIRLRADAQLPLSHVFSAAEMLGLSVYRINTVSFETEEGECPYYTVVFKGEGRDFSELLVFLTLFAGVYTAIGIYKNLE